MLNRFFSEIAWEVWFNDACSSIVRDSRIIEDLLWSDGKKIIQNFRRLKDAAFFSELTKKLIKA